ncbi:MAG: hypothetical protein GY701_15350, partial [Sulfitobacter sp.]|nr:hypothetical protein [Sulfitobacter sp.]
MGKPYAPPIFALDPSRRPPPPSIHELKDAIATFPVGTAVGTDRIHPRAFLRLPDELLHALLALFALCEYIGCWPLAMGFVLTVLLPKPDGGRRPIGILPTFARIWYRLRGPIVRAWEAEAARDYLYAGVRRGADTAAWIQAATMEAGARARAAASASTGALPPGAPHPPSASAAALIDLVKAFERVPHHILALEANALRFPAWLLRLSLAAYRIPRRISIGGVLSVSLVATRGITAGSSFATTELRLILIRCLDRVRARYPPPLFRMCVYVDDMFLSARGTCDGVLRDLPRATRLLAAGVRSMGLDVSDTKSEGIASSPALCERLSVALASLGMAFSSSAKSLGVDISATCA